MSTAASRSGSAWAASSLRADGSYTAAVGAAGRRRHLFLVRRQPVLGERRRSHRRDGRLQPSRIYRRRQRHQLRRLRRMVRGRRLHLRPQGRRLQQQFQREGHLCRRRGGILSVAQHRAECDRRLHQVQRRRQRAPNRLPRWAGEWLAIRGVPATIYTAYTYTDASFFTDHINTWFVGIRLYFNDDSRTLVERHREGTTGWAGKKCVPGAVVRVVVSVDRKHACHPRRECALARNSREGNPGGEDQPVSTMMRSALFNSSAPACCTTWIPFPRTAASPRSSPGMTSALNG